MCKKMVSLLLVLILLGALTACAPRAPAEIKIGVSAEITGGIPVVGASCKNAAEMAVKEVNDAGGLEVGGKKYKIVLQIEDNEDKAESAAAVAQKLNAAGVLVHIGPNASRNAIPASTVCEDAKLPMISPWSTAVKTTLGKKFVFRAGFVDDFQGVVVAKFAINNLKANTAAVLYDVASEYNKGIAEVFKKTFEAEGKKVIAFETYTTGDKDFSAQLTKIKASNADVLFLPNYYSEVPLQVQQAHKLGYTGTILGSDSWANLEIIDLCGADCEGLFFVTHYAPDIATPKAQKFIQGYEAAYGKTPDDVAALTYDSFGLAFQAIQTAGKIDRQAVRDALASMPPYEGVTGAIQYRGSGDPVKSAVICQIKNAKFVYYTTAAP